MLGIIPAIDLLRGKAVRLQRGAFESEMRIAEDPVKVVGQFAADGATFLHIVDLDGARTGDPQNLTVIRDIIRRVPNLRVQVGGGIRTIGRIEQVLRIGASRIIVETTVASDSAVIGVMLEKYAEQIIVGVDTKDDHVVVHGWLSASQERTEDFGLRLAGMGAKRFLYTDMSRDGMLEGVNAQATAAFARTTGRPTLAAGGVSGPGDIKILAELQPHGVEGVIIGKALYAGKLTVADALKIARMGAEWNRAKLPPPPESTGPLPDWLKED